MSSMPGKICYICGRGFGTTSLPIHQKQCLAKREAEQKLLPKHMRTKLVKPPEGGAPGGANDNDVAFSTFKNSLAPCPNCARTFLPDRLEVHLRSCKPGARKRAPASPATSSPGSATSPASRPSSAAGSPARSPAPRTGRAGPTAKRSAVSRASQPQEYDGSGGEDDEEPVDEEEPVATPARARPIQSSNTPQSMTESPGGDDAERVDCPDCGRMFAPEALAKHQRICKKVFGQKRKQFNTTKARVAGTDAAAFANRGKYEDVPKVKTNWRQKHEQFINAVRAAREVDKVVKAGGDLSSLPPPPPDEHPEYVQCPHCMRRFNETAAERHIPKCATTVNKPPPVPTTNRYARSPAGGSKASPSARSSKASDPRGSTLGSARQSAPPSRSSAPPAKVAADPRRTSAAPPRSSGGRTAAPTSAAPTSTSRPTTAGGRAAFCGECGQRFGTGTQKFCGDCGAPRI